MVSRKSTNTFISLPANTAGIVSGVGIATAPITNLFGGVNLSLSGARNSMPSCRICYPQIQIKPELLIPYIELFYFNLQLAMKL